MPVLPNPKHERFAQAVVAGHKLETAYVHAGYKPNKGHASTLKNTETVRNRIAELQQASADVLTAIHSKAADVTRETILNELEEARQLALANQNPNAAVQAVMGKARVQGLIVDRREVGEPGEFTEMSDAELVAKAARDARELGIAGPVPVEDEDAA